MLKTNLNDMNKINLVILAVLLLAFGSCGTKENPLEKERIELKKTLDEDSPLTFYKGVKVSLRSLPLDKDYNNTDSLRNDNNSEEIPQYTWYLIQKILGANQGDGEISLLEGIQIIKTFNELKEKLKTTDEDSYPTVFEVLLYVTDSTKSEEYKEFMKMVNWNNSKEHLVFGSMLMAAKPLPKTFQLYEFSKLEVNELDKNEIKPFGAIIKGSSLLLNDWLYLSEESISQGIASLEKDDLEFLYKDYPALFKGAKVNSKKAQITQLHGFSCLLRGFARSKMDDDDKNELALDDFELFLKDAEEIGADDELVWFAGAYLNIKKENSSEAIKYLEKFKESDVIIDKEKKAIDEIISYLDTREPDKALNTIYDKLFIGKLVIRNILEYMKELEWYQKIENSETGKKLLEMPKVLEEEHKKVKEEIDPNKLLDKGGEMLKDIF